MRHTHWWSNMSDMAQAEYIRLHPKTRMVPRTRLNKMKEELKNYDAMNIKITHVDVSTLNNLKKSLIVAQGSLTIQSTYIELVDYLHLKYNIPYAQLRVDQVVEHFEKITGWNAEKIPNTGTKELHIKFTKKEKNMINRLIDSDYRDQSKLLRESIELGDYEGVRQHCKDTIEIAEKNIDPAKCQNDNCDTHCYIRAQVRAIYSFIKHVENKEDVLKAKRSLITLMDLMDHYVEDLKIEMGR